MELLRFILVVAGLACACSAYSQSSPPAPPSPTPGAEVASPNAAGKPAFPRSRAELDARLASGTSPLDALTPHGKHIFLAGVSWGEPGLTGFNTAILRRELTVGQIAAVLGFLNVPNYIGMLTDGLADVPPLRFAAPDAGLERSALELKGVREDEWARQRATHQGRTVTGAPELAGHYRSAFSARMRSASLRTSTPADLQVLFDVAAFVFQESHDDQALRDLGAVYREFKRRHIDTRRTFDHYMLHAMLAARRFDRARAFASRLPTHQAARIPRTVDRLGARFRGRSVFDVSADGETLTRAAVALQPGIQIVMAVDAGCGFSADALAAISEDSEFRDLLQRQGLLILTPPRSSVPFNFIRTWNTAHPRLPVRVAARGDEWAEIGAAVPAFFIFENGRLRETVSGWPKEGQKQALRAALESHQ